MHAANRELGEQGLDEADQSGSWPVLVAVLLVLILMLALAVFFKLHFFDGGISNTVTT